MAKQILKAAMLRYNEQFPLEDLPLVLQTDGTKHVSKAKKDVEVGELRVPVHWKKPSSLIQIGVGTGTVSPKAVQAVVGLPTTKREQYLGLESGENEIFISVQPELSLPKRKEPAASGGAQAAEAADAFEWTNKSAVHPFWTIARQEKEDEETNCELVRQTTTLVIATSPEGNLAVKADADIATVRVAIPCIVNAKEIKANERIVLKWTLLREKKGLKGKKETSWHGTLKQQEQNKRRLGNPHENKEL